jgi:hypothetical protein
MPKVNVMAQREGKKILPKVLPICMLEVPLLLLTLASAASVVFAVDDDVEVAVVDDEI